MKLIIGFIVLAFAVNSTADINLLTDRPLARLQVVADKYAAITGIKVSVVENKYPDILAKLKSETSAGTDVVLVKDGVYLQELVDNNLLQSMTSDYINKNVLPSQKDKSNRWTFVTTRARTLVYDASVDVSQINSYADLATQKYSGILCLRSSKGSYNEALFAELIVNYGQESAKSIANGLVANRASDKFYADDTAILTSISNGDCNLGIANSYYLGLLLAKEPNLPLKIKFLDQSGAGAHVNGMGAGVVAGSAQKVEATKFIEFLLSNEIQLFLTGEQMDYPAKVGLKPQTLVNKFGDFKPSSTDWSLIGSKVSAAKKIFQEVKYE